MMCSRVPEVRFAGFDGDWVEKTLGNVVVLLKDGTHGTHKDGTDAFLLSAKNIKNGKVLINDITDRKISINDYNSIYKSYKLKNQDVLLTIVGTIGQTALYEEISAKVAFQRSVAIIRGNYDINHLFLYSLMNSYYIQKQLKQSASMSAQAGVYLGDLENIKINFTDLQEQTQIGNFFKQLDDTIVLHQRELDNLKQTKKGFLQKMFPKDGEMVPEVRFAGFDGDWVEKKLGDIAIIIGGGTPSTSIPEYWDGEIDWYSPTEIGSEIYANGSVRKITSLGLQKSSAKILPAEKTILFTSRAGIGDMAILLKNGATNQGFQSLVIKEKYDIYFVYSCGNKLKDFAMKYASGSTFLEISGISFSKMNICIPSLQEQSKIGNFFKQLDDTIVLHQRELQNLKQTKKAFLQKMFI